MAKVAIERDGPVTVVSIDRFAEARNAVDPETALLLREAFLAFDADEKQSVAILTGHGGTFCAGFDLKVAASRESPTLLNAVIEVMDDDGEFVLEFPFSEAIVELPDENATRH